MIWIMAIVATVVAAYAIIASVEIMKLKKEILHLIRRADSTNGDVANLAISLSNTDEKLKSVIDTVEEIKKDPTVLVDEAIKKAYVDVMTQDINSIVNYSPYKKE